MRKNVNHSNRVVWSRMHARGSARQGWRYKTRFESLGEAWTAARQANRERGEFAKPLRPYPCNWTDTPPPNAKRSVSQHYHIGRASVDAPTQPG